MDKERQNKTLTLSELLNNSVLKNNFNKTAYSNFAKQATIFSFWGNVAGQKLAKLSKPYKIKNSKLYITTKSATVSQQIILIKNQIIEKINSFSKPLGIEIKEITVSYKNYDEITTEKNIPLDEKLNTLEKKELDNIELEEEIITSIEGSIDKISFLNEEQKQKLVEKILTNFKAKKYRKNIQNR